MRARSVSVLATVFAVALLQACTVFYSLDGYDDGTSATSGGGASSTSTTASTGSAGGDAAAKSQYRAEVLADKPIAYWRLGEHSGAAAYDETGHYDGQYIDVELGAPGALDGDRDTAARFTKATSAVKIGEVPGFTGGASFTIEAWANPDYAHAASSAGQPRILTKELSVDGKQQGFSLVDNINDNGLTFQTYRDGKFHGAYIDANLAAEVYSHVVVTYAAATDAGTLTIYVNDVIASQSTVEIDLVDDGTNLVLGALSTTRNAWSGELDEIALYDHAITVERVDAHYRAARGEDR